MREVEVVYEGRKVKYKVRGLTYGEYLTILKKVAKVEIINKNTNAKYDFPDFLEELMKLSVEGEVDWHKLIAGESLKLQQIAIEESGLGDSFQ